MTSSQVDRFWKWFEDNQEDIIRAVKSDDDSWLRQELTSRVVALTPEGSRPRLNWEIGRGCEKEWRFCFSPLVEDNLALTEKIVARVPLMERWEFFDAKPPRLLSQLSYRLADETGEEYSFLTDDWDYVLLSHGDGCFSIDIVGDIPTTLDVEFRRRVAYLLVEGLLGERFTIEHIGKIRLFHPKELDPNLPKTKLVKLRKHLDQLLAPPL
jgi:hypothetical protein